MNKFKANYGMTILGIVIPFYFASDDLLLVGVPVYSGRIPQLLNTVFENVKGHRTKAVFVALYGNRDYDDASRELKNIFDYNSPIPLKSKFKI